MRGRKPKRTRIKLLTGNPGKRPLNLAEPRPEPAVPDCPPELGPGAQREWTRLVATLGPLRELHDLAHIFSRPLIPTTRLRPNFDRSPDYDGAEKYDSEKNQPHSALTHWDRERGTAELGDS